MGETAFSKEASSLFGERRLRDGVRLREPQEGSRSGLAAPGGGRPRNTACLLRHRLLLSVGSHPSLAFHEQDVYPPGVLKHSFIGLGSSGLVCRAQASRTQAGWGCAVPGGAFRAAEPFVPMGCSRPALTGLDQGPPHGRGGHGLPGPLNACAGCALLQGAWPSCWQVVQSGCIRLPSLGPGSRLCLPGGWGTFSFVQKPLCGWPWDLPGLISEETCITIALSCCILILWHLGPA